MRKLIPKFKNEKEERTFWSTHDSTEYLDWSKARKALFPKLKPSTRTISLRLPEFLLDELKSLANKRDVPYQSLLKVLLAEKVEEEMSPYGKGWHKEHRGCLNEKRLSWRRTRSQEGFVDPYPFKRAFGWMNACVPSHGGAFSDLTVRPKMVILIGEVVSDMVGGSGKGSNISIGCKE